jgi:hypothetical protein
VTTNGDFGVQGATSPLATLVGSMIATTMRDTLGDYRTGQLEPGQPYKLYSLRWGPNSSTTTKPMGSQTPVPVMTTKDFTIAG